MADTDFYKAEIVRLQEKNAEYQRIWLKAIGVLASLAPNCVIDGSDVVDIARNIFDRVCANYCKAS